MRPTRASRRQSLRNCLFNTWTRGTSRANSSMGDSESTFEETEGK